MRAVSMWLRAEARSRWRAWLGLALLLGVAGGAVVAAAAAARRTDTVYDRFLIAQNAPDVLTLDDGALGISIDLDKVVHLPQVAAYARGGLISYLNGNQAAVAAVDDRLGVRINRFKVLRGRMYDPTKDDEAVVGFEVARQAHLHLGSTIPLVTPDELANIPEGELSKEDLAQFRALLPYRLRVVGIVAAPAEFPPQFIGLYPSIHLTPAFFRRFGNFQAGAPEGGTLFIKLKRGPADVSAFSKEVEDLAPGQPSFIQSSRDLGALTRRAFRFQALGLALLAAFGAVAVLLVFGQALSRQTLLGADEFPSLRALGLGRRNLWLTGVLRAAVVGSAAGAISIGVAFPLSTLAPAGAARIAEPHPGFAFDASAIGIGAAALAVFVVVASTVPAWRAARVAGSLGVADFAAAQRPSQIATALSRTGLPPSIVGGSRLALEPGHGRTAVPVRSTLAGVTVGIIVLAAALTFGSSLDHLLATPRLYGVRWDNFLTNFGTGPDLNRNDFAAVPGISDLALGADGPLVVGGKLAPLIAVDPVRGNATPPIVEGRAPAKPDEIALGTTTFRRMHARIGGDVRGRLPIGRAPEISFTIVGRTVIAPSGRIATEPGEGALLTMDGIRRIVGPDGNPLFSQVTDAWVRYSPGVDRSRVLQRLQPLFGTSLTDEKPETPVDIVNFGRVQNLPLMLGGVLGFVAAATLAHTIASSVRRRRGDLAILKTMGFVRRQVRATVAWQATMITTFALVIGIPIGVAIGRWLWSRFADQVGLVPESAVAAWAIALLVPGALLLANAVAALPARAAARVRPALVLRTE
jgi:FtsX-like permease family